MLSSPVPRQRSEEGVGPTRYADRSFAPGKAEERPHIGNRHSRFYPPARVSASGAGGRLPNSRS